MKCKGLQGYQPLSSLSSVKSNNTHKAVCLPDVCELCSGNTKPRLTADCNYCYKTATPVGWFPR